MSIPRMNYPQYRKARKLTHECCNYCDGNCLLLDDVEECVCVACIPDLLLENHLFYCVVVGGSSDRTCCSYGSDLRDP